MSTLAEPRRRTVQRSVAPLRQTSVTEQDNGLMTITGPLVTYGAVNKNGWLWVPGACTEWLREQSQTGNPVPMGYQHSFMEPLTVIGKWTELREDVRGLYGQGRISDVAAGRDASTLIKDQAINGISVGFFPDDTRLMEPGEAEVFDTPFGQFTYTLDAYALAITESDISEASVVSEPADDDARIDGMTQAFAKAGKALPGLRQNADWPDAAYSMALLMGGRGAAAFADLPEFEHHTLYQRLAKAYQRLGKTPPTYERAPEYKRVQFAHDERAVFQDRYLRKGLASVASGAAGFEGPLSHETRAEAERAVHALQDLIVRPRDPKQAALIAEIQALNADLASLKLERNQ